ncbi:MAG: hypothetical protein CMO76_09045 [Verrucomicrobiales bacterium]|nr:hypothetical protein [Verrucomicrobiales bacterium]
MSSQKSVIIQLDFIGLILLPLILSSCSTPTGQRYPREVRETTFFLESNSPQQFHGLKKRKKEDQIEFYFCDGSKCDNVEVVFPLRVTVSLISNKQGERSNLKLRAYRQGLFLSQRKRDFEDKWRNAILFYLNSIQPNS